MGSFQDLLQSVMVRTERLAASGNRSGMLRDERAAMCRVAPEDVQSFVGVDRVVRTLADVPGMVEYWKSAPYLFNFMDEYKVRKEISKRIDQDDGEIRAGLNGSHMLDWRRLEQFKRVEPMNGRLRWLLDDLAIPAADQDDLPALYRKLSKGLKLAPDDHSEQVFKQILGNCQSVVESLGALRNKLGDAHGGGPKRARPAARHAELAVNLAGSMATFLIATWDAKRSIPIGTAVDG